MILCYVLGQISCLAGTGDTGNLDGPALSATFGRNLGLAVDNEGCTYVADADNELIRKISLDGIFFIILFVVFFFFF